MWISVQGRCWSLLRYCLGEFLKSAGERGKFFSKTSGRQSVNIEIINRLIMRHETCTYEQCIISAKIRVFNNIYNVHCMMVHKSIIWTLFE